MTEYNSFETERLILKATTEEDAAFILELVNTPKWLQYIGDRNVHSLDDAQKYIKYRILPQQQRLGYSNYTLIKKSDSTKIGTCGLYDREGLKGIDIGFAFLPAFEGQGFAYEAAAKLLSLAFEVFDLKEINAITAKDNIASQRLLEKLGLQLNGTTYVANDAEELFFYKICRAE